MMLSDTVRLRNSDLEVELFADRPIVRAYRVTALNGSVFSGADRDGCLCVDGAPVPWDRCTIHTDFGSTRAAYTMALQGADGEIEIRFALAGAALVMTIDASRAAGLHSLSWEKLPLISCADPGFSWWRVAEFPGRWPHTHVEARGLWRHACQSGRVGGALDEAPVAATYGCLYNRDRVGVCLDTNSVLSKTMQQARHGGYTISPASYRPVLRGSPRPPLRVEVAFFGDLNGDGAVDANDYRLWLNGRMPESDPLLRKSVAYKIFLDSPETGVTTTYSESREIVRAVANVTGGLPQIAYLVGWQYTGHDTGYPSLDVINTRPGSADELLSLMRSPPDEANTVVSVHANVDDAYEESKDFDPALMARDFDGSPMFWFEAGGRTCFHLSHTRDVERGTVVERIDRLLGLLPLRRVIHLDAMRTTNCNPEWEPDGIGIAEELECGLRPILTYLRERGLSVTTEGQNGMPHEVAGLVEGFWHLDGSPELLQIHHRSIVGGGLGDGAERRACFLGTSLHQDISCRPLPHTLCYAEQWHELVDRIYLGTLLYHFYLEQRMLGVYEDETDITVRYSAGVVARYGKADDALLVTQHGRIVAMDDDRFIPRDGAIYAYSVDGVTRRWYLPDRMVGPTLHLTTLTRDGAGAPPDHEVRGDTIELKLLPRTPVKITVMD